MLNIILLLICDNKDVQQTQIAIADNEHVNLFVLSTF